MEDEKQIQECIEVIRAEQKASVSLLQRRLRLGYIRAAAIMDELEKRGIVGPSKGAEPRDVFLEKLAVAGVEVDFSHDVLRQELSKHLNGVKCRMRNGEIATISIIDSSASYYPIRGYIKNRSEEHMWSDRGTYYVHTVKADSFDLVRILMPLEAARTE